MKTIWKKACSLMDRRDFIGSDLLGRNQKSYRKMRGPALSATEIDVANPGKFLSQINYFIFKHLAPNLLIKLLLIYICLLCTVMPCFSWGSPTSPTTHMDITEISLSKVAGSKLANEISYAAWEPDIVFIKPGEPRLGAVLLNYSHRITEYKNQKDGKFYEAPGAEVAAAELAGMAKMAFQSNDKNWTKYLGWATHYLADALCPAHCFPESDQKRAEFWSKDSRDAKFEAYFGDLDEEEFNYAKEAMEDPESICKFDANFSKPSDIINWIKQKAKIVYQKSPKSVDLPYFDEKDLKEIFALISIGIRGLYFYVTNACTTATMLVMDVSRSMSWTWQGGVKIDSAKKAALQFIEQVMNEPRAPGSRHLIGIVTFSDSANLVLPLTDDYSLAKHVVISLGTLSSTNLGAGLQMALKELDRVSSSARRFIILLSDGMTNTGLSRDQILSGPVAEARAKGICIYTVGFGDPGDIDEDFLKQIAHGSGCGMYNYAASELQLFGTYVKIRHSILGSNRIVEFSSGTGTNTKVYVLPGQSIALGAFWLTGSAQELHYTLAWSGPGVLRAKLVDPSGREVNYAYPGAKFYSGNGFSHVTVFSPQAGVWRAVAVVATGFPQGVEYYGVVSARTGGYVIPYAMPKICITRDICIPLPDMPTFLMVFIASITAAIWIYLQLIGS